MCVVQRWEDEGEREEEELRESLGPKTTDSLPKEHSSMGQTRPVVDANRDEGCRH